MKNRDVRIYLATSMGGSPFIDPISLKIFASLNCCITKDISSADVIVAHNLKNLLPGIIRYTKKKFLVWTNEPRVDTNFKRELKLPFGLPQIDIMNVYGNEVFWHNFHFLASYHFDNTNNLGIDITKPLPHITKSHLLSLNKKNKIAALFTNTLSSNNKLIRSGKDIDLSLKRCKYAISGHQRKLLDIYGNKWPNGYAQDNSGFGFEKNRPWWIEKIEILKGYKFNLCFENTASPYYVTEKIWHAIISYCLPIYSSFNSSIYETFPENSFIDANLFKDENDLFDYIMAMSEEEFIHRLNLCIDVFNKALFIKSNNYEMNANEMVDKIVKRLTN